MAVNLTRVLAHHADRHPERIAIECDGESLTWGELHSRTSRTAGALGALGVNRADVVGVLLHNGNHFIELMYACAHLGAVFMPLSWRLAGPELNYIVNHAQARVLVSDPELAELLEDAGELDCDQVVGVAAGPGWPVLDDLRAAAEPLDTPAHIEGEDVARLMYTSGTTSRPKGVMITFDNLEAKNLAHLVEFGITGEHRALVCGPLYHVGGLDMITTTVLQAGGSTFILSRFDPAAALRAVEEHAITHAWLAPVMIRAILDDPSLAERDLTSMQVINGGGEKMPLPLIKRLQESFPNVWFADAYGMTETVSGDTFLDRHATIEKIGSVGKSVFNTELRVVDEDGRQVEPGAEGEIVMRGPKVCKGYYRDPDATAAAIREGWLLTGDVGVVDDDGYLFIVDRLKDMIISGGENIASSEVERVLYEHPAIDEVAVVGSPDPRWQEVPVAYVVCRGASPTAEELEEFCREQLSRFKVPHGFRFVGALPRNPAGKVLKRELRDREERYQDRIGALQNSD